MEAKIQQMSNNNDKRAVQELEAMRIKYSKLETDNGVLEKVLGEVREEMARLKEERD